MNLNTKTNLPFDLSEVQHVERIVIGRYQDNGHEDEAWMASQIEKLNGYLQGVPKGLLMGKDVSFKVIRQGEHTVVAQQVAYHIGFKRKPITI